jgi:fatty acid-binding protein DegV
MVKIITESTCDMDCSLLKDYDVSVIPLTVNLYNRLFQNGIDLGPD